MKSVDREWNPTDPWARTSFKMQARQWRLTPAPPAWPGWMSTVRPSTNTPLAKSHPSNPWMWLSERQNWKGSSLRMLGWPWESSRRRESWPRRRMYSKILNIINTLWARCSKSRWGRSLWSRGNMRCYKCSRLILRGIWILMILCKELMKMMRCQNIRLRKNSL